MLHFMQFVLTHLFGVLTPGPGFLLVAENSVIYGMKYGMITSFGLNAAYIIHLSFIVFNTNAHIITNPFIWNPFCIFGALFLTYLAWKTLKNKNSHKLDSISHNPGKFAKTKWFSIFSEAFVVGVFNVKGFMLFLMLLQTFASEDNITYYAAWIPCSLVFYHLIMSYCMTRHAVRAVFVNHIKGANKIFASLLLFFAIRVLLNIKI